MKHVHHDMIIEWAKDTSRVVEVETDTGWQVINTPVWRADSEYRFKPAEPKYIIVNGVNVPEPVREPLEEGQSYWLVECYMRKFSEMDWHNSPHHKRWLLSLGLIHLTKEAAQTHIDAMLLPSRTDK